MKRRDYPWMMPCAWSLAALLAGSCAACSSAPEVHVDEDAQSDALTNGDAADATAGTLDVPLTFTPICKADSDCTGGNCVDGVCVLTPTEVGNLSDPTNDYQPATGTLETGCVDEAFADQIKGLPDVPTATVWGIVDRFGGGDLTSNVEVDVFKIGDFHPEACAGIADADARATCFLDPTKVGTPLGHTISIDPDQPAVTAGIDIASPKKAGDQCVHHLDCPNGYECQKSNANAGEFICVKAHGVYAIPGMPTNTELVMRVRKHDPNSDWHDSYYWDIVLFSDHIDPMGAGKQPTKYIGTPTYHVNPTIVGQGEWQLVPETLGMNDIAQGDGVVGGSISDCGDSTRGGYPIHDVKIAMGVPPAGMAFFNDSEDDTVPIKNKQSTDTLGRFAAVDLPPGANRVSATVMIGTTTLKLGSRDVFVVPDALMIVSLPGRIPVLTK